MVFKLHDKVKMILSGVCTIIILISFIQIYRTATKNEIKTEETVTYECTYAPEINYQVFIHKNPVYEGTTMGENVDYSKKLLDYIEVTFNSDLIGSMPADLNIQYEIKALVQGYQTVDQVKTVSWSKSYPLAKKETVNLSNVNWNNSKTIKVKLDKYDAFATDAIAVTGMDLNNEVLIQMTGTIDIHTKEGDINIPIDSMISVPLRTDVFTITKAELTPVEQQITTTQEFVVPPNAFLLGLYATLAVIGLTGIVFLFFFTINMTDYDLVYGKVKKTIKNHGSRMIAVHYYNNRAYEQSYEVNSIEDLVKTSDEVQKPIFYVMDKNQMREEFPFYLIDKDILYTYIVRACNKTSEKVPTSVLQLNNMDLL